MNRTFLVVIASSTFLLCACGDSGSRGGIANSAPAAPASKPPAVAAPSAGVVARESESNQIIGYNGTTTGPEGATKDSAPGSIKSIGVDGVDVGKPIN